MHAPRSERDPRRGPTAEPRPIGRAETVGSVLTAPAADVGLAEVTRLARAATSAMAAGESP